MCSVPQSAHSNAVGAVTESGMAEMVEVAEVVVGTVASCMVPAPVGWQTQHVQVPLVRGEQ